jgi:tRNA(Ile)-lysidine synthase
VIVAVSGGADSVSLLLAMHDLVERQKLRLRLVAGHFNHRLRGDESDRDQHFVKGLTTRLKIELVTGSGDVPVKGNLEQNARDLRYLFLCETAKRLNAYAVLTGHTINDQAETFLMNLIRGSGPEGLAGMPAIRELESETRGLVQDGKGTEVVAVHGSKYHSPVLIRPLLTWARRIDTEAFCRDLGVEYRYDTMNEDTAFKRVRIRKILLPLLQDFNPNIVEILANTGALMRHVSDLKRQEDASTLDKEMSLSNLRALSRPQLYEKLRDWLGQHRGSRRQLGLKHIAAIERLIFSSKSGRTAELPGGTVTKNRGTLVYKENKVEN